MRCPACSTTNIIPIQENKEDYYLCVCGSYHKGFPYSCPIKFTKYQIIEMIVQARKDLWNIEDLKDSDVDRRLTKLLKEIRK